MVGNPQTIRSVFEKTKTPATSASRTGCVVLAIFKADSLNVNILGFRLSTITAPREVCWSRPMMLEV